MDAAFADHVQLPENLAGFPVQAVCDPRMLDVALPGDGQDRPAAGPGRRVESKDAPEPAGIGRREKRKLRLPDAIALAVDQFDAAAVAAVNPDGCLACPVSGEIVDDDSIINPAGILLGSSESTGVPAFGKLSAPFVQADYLADSVGNQDAVLLFSPRPGAA